LGALFAAIRLLLLAPTKNKTNSKKASARSKPRVGTGSTRMLSAAPRTLTYDVVGSRPYPDSALATLTFTEPYQLTVSTLPGDYRIFSLSGAYDPLYSIGGGSCTGFSWYAGIYKRYYVESVFVHAYYTNMSLNSSGFEQRAFLKVVPSSQIAAIPSTAAIRIDDVVETQHTLAATTAPNGRPDCAAVLERTYIPWQSEQLANKLSDYLNMSSLVTTVPTRSPVVVAGIVGCFGPKSGCVGDILVTIKYKIRFWEPSTLAQV